MIKTERLCLLLTGCISPSQSVNKLAVISPETRRKQVIEAIRFFITKTCISQIVYCDNSDALPEGNLITFAEEYGKELEWIGFQGNTQLTIEKGKGYGEGEIVEYAINNSSLIKKNPMLLKVTGRLYVKNINAILRLTHETNSYLDFHKGYVDTRCYLVKLSDYKCYLLHAHEEVEDNRNKYIENIFYEIGMKNRSVFHPFPIAFDIFGVSGSMGVSYSDSKVKHFAKTIKTAMRAIIWHIRGVLRNQ